MRVAGERKLFEPERANICEEKDRTEGNATYDRNARSPNKNERKRQNEANFGRNVLLYA